MKEFNVNFNVVKTIDNNIKHNCSRLDLWFYGRENENFIYYEDVFFGLKNQILLKNLLDEPEITVSKSCLWLDKFYPPRSRGSIQSLIDSVIRIKQIQEGYLPIHAACVSNDEHTILIVAYPNVGKTLSCLQLLKEGYKYISDDTVLVDKNGYAYLTSFSAGIGQRDFLKFIKPSDIGKWKYYQTLLRAKIYESNKIIERIIQPPKIALGEIFPTKDKAKVDIIATVEIGPKRIEKIDMFDITTKIMKINNYSLSRLNNPLIWAYSYFNNDFNVEEIEGINWMNLSDFVENCGIYYSLSCNDWNWIKIFKEIL